MAKTKKTAKATYLRATYIWAGLCNIFLRVKLKKYNNKNKNNKQISVLKIIIFY